MKFLLLVLFAGCCCTAQHRLYVSGNSCKPYYSEEMNDCTISVFRNDTLLKSSGFPFIYLEGLPQGDYKVVYQTAFGKQSSEYFKLDEDDSDLPTFYDFCADTPPQNKVDLIKAEGLFLDLMTDGEEVVVNYSYYGCFSEGERQIVITKKKGRYYAMYKGKKRRIKKRRENALKDFEVELRCLELPGNIFCTSGSETTISYQGQKITDRGVICYGWHGFSNLLDALHLKW